MNRHSLLVLLLLAFLSFTALPAPAAGDPWLIQGGRSVGPFLLGQDISLYQEALGPLEARESSKPGMTGFYSKRTDLMFLTKKGMIVGITVFSPRYHTAGKLQVGSQRSLVRATLGAWLELRSNNVVYPQKGLAFTFSKGVVAQIFVVEAEPTDPLRGDGFLVPGVRAGNLMLGMSFARVAGAWGQADEETPGDAGTLYKYSTKGKGLVLNVSGGKLTGIMVHAGDYETREGVRVGSTRAQILKIYGKKCRESDQMLEYPAKGIGFVMGDGKVIQMMVVAPVK